MRSCSRIGALLLGLAAMPAQAAGDAPWTADMGDGRYRNPVLAGDYSDPDAVRVGDDYYLTSSSFTNVPGLPILHSRDLVNWRIIGHALPRLHPEAHHSVPRRGGGVWAPAIRHHKGRFLIYYPDPDFGIFVVSADDPKGPWSKPVLVENERGVIDPAPFWDEDGTGWLAYAYARSRAGKANRIMLRRLNADGTRTVGEAKMIIDGDAMPRVRTSRGPMPWLTTEGPKLYKRDGWYYVFAPSGSVEGGWQGVFRSRRIDGPYEGRDVLDEGGTGINGPHQGALVDTPSGESWFLHFQDTGSYGRRVHLQPITWRKDWPVIGIDPDGDGIGKPVLAHAKPKLPAQPAGGLQASDDFDGALSSAWQWSANPREDWADLTARPGWLRLKSASQPVNLYEAAALLTQKLPGPAFTATTRLEFVPSRDGERAGLLMFGTAYGWVGVERSKGTLHIVQVRRDDAIRNAAEALTTGPAIESGKPVWLRLAAEPVEVAVPPPSFSPYWPTMLRTTHAKTRFSYSFDGVNFVPLGTPFESRPGRWVGAQIGLFAQAPADTPAYVATSVGHADFDGFTIGTGE